MIFNQNQTVSILNVKNKLIKTSVFRNTFLPAIFYTVGHFVKLPNLVTNAAIVLSCNLLVYISFCYHAPKCPANETIWATVSEVTNPPIKASLLLSKPKLLPSQR